MLYCEKESADDLFRTIIIVPIALFLLFYTLVGFVKSGSMKLRIVGSSAK